MKNNKLFKFAATAVLGVMTATSAIGLTACDTGNGGNGGHRWSTEWTYDSNNHWHKCLDDDGAETTHEPHNIENDECTVCDYQKHHFSQQWSSDEQKHWHECEDADCNERRDEDDHDFVDGECSVCHYEKEEEGDFNLATYTISGQVTNNLQKVFKVGDTFNSNNLTVFDKDSGEKLSDEEYVVALKDGDSMDTAGKKTVEVISGERKSTYKIYVLDLSGVSTTGEASVTVDAHKAVEVSGNVVTVKSINDALKVYELLGVGANVKKPVNVADGDYFEKVYINVPNVKLTGTSQKQVGAGESGNNGAVIWFDNLAGEKDPSGNEIGTFASYSVRVGASASGFEARNITFKNKYNTHELYTQSESYLQEKFGNKNTQAVALRVDSGNAEFYNCKMTGYHDTLHIEGGNHYYEGCWIEGHTDYIFGNNSNTYFYKCNIYTIGSGNANNGGYVVANRPATPDYNCVFNKCVFDADENTVANTASLGRPWGANMKMTVIYSTISGKFSTKAHTLGNNNGDRYCTMSGVDPNPEYMMEYGNTGDGAISSSLANTCTYLTEQQAAAYVLDKIEDILGFVPGEGDAKKLYDFATQQAASGTGTKESPAQLFGGEIEIVGKYSIYYTGSKINALKVDSGAVITLKVSGKVTIGWFGGGYGGPEDADINYKNGCAIITIIRPDNNCHINTITVNTARPGEHAHVYGGWSVNPVPTQTSTGTAERTCTDCELATPNKQTVTLPELSEENYKLSTSDTAGKVTYTYHHAEYGDISFDAEPLAGVHVHNYGDWEVKPENIPTNEKVGAVTRTCQDNDCNHDESSTQSKELPVLTDSRYKITGNTATAESEGTGTYTITIDGIDNPVSFTAATPQLTTTTFNFGTLPNASNTNYPESAPAKPFGEDALTIVGSFRQQNGTGIQIEVGSVITLQVKGSISVVWYGSSYGTEANGKITYKDGYATLTIVSDTASTGGIYIKSITVDHTDIPADTVVELACITEGFIFGAYSSLTSSENALINGVTVHNTKYLLLGSGADITVKIGQGTTITLYGDGNQGSAVKFNETLTSATSDNTFTYTADAEETVKITSTGTTYILYLNVDCGVTYTTGDNISIGEIPAQCQGTKGGYHSVAVDATSGKWAVSGSQGGYKYAQVNPNTKFTFKVTDGITKDNIKLIEYTGNALTEGTHYTIDVTGGEVTINVIGTGSLYVRSIQIV